MQTPADPARDAAMLEGMEGLIAAMKDRQPAPDAVGSPSAMTRPPVVEVEASEDGLAAAPWGAVRLASLAAATRTYALERGAIVGRHVVLDELGAGGMGVVYVAYDPQLDRKVALKLLLPGATGDTGRTRLLREAQALGKLAHPNVVGIHDVGTVGEQVWLAMEFVQGQTLSAWLGTPRAWRDVLAVMRSAGEGLAAAHAAGLLHRDFKPDNVMVGDDGRVRVMDFGLARARAKTVTLEDDEPSPVSTQGSLAVPITQLGTLVGTPSYMAPEQFGSEELTAAADQFAFCVTLWEALYGERPFGGRSWMELCANVMGGRLRAPPKGRAVPSWLQRVCVRGLAVDPKQRWPSMNALLDTLARGRTRARIRKGLVVVGMLALLGASVEGHRRLDHAQRIAACKASGAEIETAWSPARAQALRDALVGTGVSYAPTVADKTVPWLEQHAAAWRGARVEACLDTNVRGRWDHERLDRSLWCLDERRMQLQSLVDELTLADAEVLQKAVSAAAGLDSVAPCSDENVLEALEPPPDENREAIRAVRAEVTAVRSLTLAGRYAKGIELARGALERAEALGWRPLSAAARLGLGSLLHYTGAYAETETALVDAYFEAADGVAPEVALEAATELVVVVGQRLARPAEGRQWSRHAELALAQTHDGERLRRAMLLMNLGSVHYTTGDYDQAKVSYERTLALFIEALGPDHPNVAAGLTRLADVHKRLGAHDEAKALYRRALAIQETALGPEHPYVAGSLAALAFVHLLDGSYDEASALYEQALVLDEEAFGPKHPYVASDLGNLASVRTAVGANDEAKVYLERALTIFVEVLGPRHPDVATVLVKLAEANYKTGANDEAKALYQQSLDVFVETLGPTHPNVGYPLLGLADIALDQHRPSDAVSLALRAVTVWEKSGIAGHDEAGARFTLARALWEAPMDGGGDRVRAVLMAERARDGHREAGEAGAAEVVEVEAWLDEHRPRP